MDGAGLTAFLIAALVVAGLVLATLAVGFFAAADLAAAFLTTALSDDGFFATTLWGAAFFAGAFFAGAFFTGAFFAGTFFAATFFGATFFVGATFFADALAGAFLAADLLATDLGDGFFAAFFADALPADLLALFTLRSLFAAAFELPAPTALADVLLLCAFAPVELALLFAISLHRDQPWRPRVIADVFYTSKSISGILVPSHAACRSCNVNIFTRLILWLLGLYKRWLSPLLGARCRFHPTCSDYARIAVARFGPWRGCLLVAWRLLRCQPLCEGGDDPVPERFQFRPCRGHEQSRHPH